VVANGRVWIGTNNENPRDQSLTNTAGVLMCFRERDGQFLYQHASPARQGPTYWQAQTGISCSPLIEGDRLWFVTTSAEVACLDINPLRQGDSLPTELWKLDMMDELGVLPRRAIMGGGGLCSIAASYRDLIYVITGNGTDWPGRNVPAPFAPALVCLNKNTGTVVWEDSSPGANILFGEWGSPLVIEIDRRAQVVAPQGDGWVRSFDALTGELIWKFDINRKDSKWPRTRGFFSTSPVFYRNRIYIATGNYIEFGELPGRLCCIDPTKAGDISLELDDGPGKARPNPNSGAVWHFDGIQRTMSTVAVHNGLAVAPDFGGMVRCLDADTGQTYWTHDVRAQVFCSPLIADGKVYVADGDGEVSVLALSKEKSLLTERVTGESWITASPIYANGVLYVAAGDTLYAIQEKVAADWPQWRGPDRSNVSAEAGLLKEWPTGGPPLLWKAEGLGEGITSVAIQNGRLFTLGYREGGEHVFTLDASTGDARWTSRIGPTVQQSSLMRWLSPRTPTVDGDRLYAITFDGDLFCLRTDDGQHLWRKNYPADFAAKRPTWGFCDYPLVDGDKLICTPGGTNASIVALNKRTGEVLWKSAIPEGDGAAYAAALIVEAGGRRQYVNFLRKFLVSVDAEDGRVLWRYDRFARPTAHSYTPTVHGDFLFCASGYGNGIALLRLVPEGNGVRVEEQYFRQYPLDAFQDCTVRVGDYIYTWQQGESPSCIDLKTGQVKWGPEAGRGRGRAAVTCADGHLYFLRSDGRMVLVEAKPAGYVEKGRFQLPEPQQTTGASFPVIARGKLYLRDESRLFCYDVSEGALEKPRPDVRTVTLTVATEAKKSETPTKIESRKDRAPDAIFVPTPQDIVDKMLELAALKQKDLVYDLGSGDGRIVIAAARRYGCKAVGYEIDPKLVEQSREKIGKERLGELVRIEHADLFTADLSGADVIAVYLPSNLLQRLLPQFEKLRPGSRIVSHQFAMPGIKPEQAITLVSKEDGDQHKLFLWVAPLKKE
jgi:outer membrane protein assembly factor BamB/protein-L-isoaspartate O-methyltransferase